MNFGIDVEGLPQTHAAIDYFERGMSDLRQGAVWLRVQQAFYRIMKGQFASEGGQGKSGGWAPLSSPYKERKIKRYGNKPILQATGRTYRSMTAEGGDSIVDKQPQEMTLGTRVPQAKFHQAGTGKMPARPIIDMSDEDEKKLVEPILLRARQLVDNAKLRDRRGF